MYVPILYEKEIDWLTRQVAGPRNEGVVFVHMVKPSDTNEWEYRLLALEVKGYSRVVLEERHDPKVGGEVKIFGIRWK